MEAERIKLQIDNLVRWMKKARSGLANVNTISLEEVEKKIVILKKEYIKTIRNFNKEMLSKGEDKRVNKRIRFDDEAKAPPRQEFEAIDREQEELNGVLFFIL